MWCLMVREWLAGESLMKYAYISLTKLYIIKNSKAYLSTHDKTRHVNDRPDIREHLDHVIVLIFSEIHYRKISITDVEVSAFSSLVNTPSYIHVQVCSFRLVWKSNLALKSSSKTKAHSFYQNSRGNANRKCETRRKRKKNKQDV